ncbi:IncF plasmid conjugative transfer pilus assembly protein TraE [Rubrivivax sp. A210]|uniref:TraE/TraK family type IV conjugative transfer system protein n=1 Tax=Rubrivivax sp. A210 TaxID=2772301 RepID=UPI0019186352|nr:TraE/TraK family type IV conjugative transfer system protein [Rubrivivax sp. A210]CAD5366877.1 IncF plasmid conjugative transfer pilus assembly protein TraE [Rubrivivax sp. A210]
MNPQRQLTDIQSLASALKRQQAITIVLGLLAILLTIGSLSRQSTVVLEPPTRTKTIAITGDRVDGAWLEEMGAWVAHMILDASPHSIGWQQDQVLRWTHPAAHGQLQQEMAVQAKRLIDANASTVFWLQQLAPDLDRQRVALVGQLDTYVNGVKVQGSSRTVSYLLQFEARGGRMLVKEWKEVPGDDIWLTRALEAAAKLKEKADAKR